MSEPRWERSARLLGAQGLAKLSQCRVAVFGMGGVGSHCAEALARSGIGGVRLVDHDVVCTSNCNRQLHALESTLGVAKVAAMAARMRDVAPAIEVQAHPEFFSAETAAVLLQGELAYVVDAIDSLGPKVELLAQCQMRGIRVITALGAAGRLDPTRIRLGPLERTRGCALGAKVRKQLRRRVSLEGVTAVFSTERVQPSQPGPWSPMTSDLGRGRQRMIQPSLVMVPAAMGYAAAAHVGRELAWRAGPE